MIDTRSFRQGPQKRGPNGFPFLFACLWAASAGATDVSRDSETGLESWQVETRGIQVRLTQISGDQARAFYQARGFTPEQAERYASSCVFMTVVRNIGKSPIEHRLSEWRYVSGTGPARAIRSKAEWDKTWLANGVAAPARIAFTWAQFPSSQTFYPGDWNQGMTTYQLAPGSHFDLLLNWQSGGKLHTATLENVRCMNEIK